MFEFILNRGGGLRLQARALFKVLLLYIFFIINSFINNNFFIILLCFIT
jgi:hypothetical protein